MDIKTRVLGCFYVCLGIYLYSILSPNGKSHFMQEFWPEKYLELQAPHPLLREPQNNPQAREVINELAVMHSFRCIYYHLDNAKIFPSEYGALKESATWGWWLLGITTWQAVLKVLILVFTFFSAAVGFAFAVRGELPDFTFESFSGYFLLLLIVPIFGWLCSWGHIFYWAMPDFFYFVHFIATQLALRAFFLPFLLLIIPAITIFAVTFNAWVFATVTFIYGACFKVAIPSAFRSPA